MAMLICKLPLIVIVARHVTYFWNFGTPSISRERLEREILNGALMQNANTREDQ